MTKLNKYDYEYLTGLWEGPLGAAFNTTYAFCRDAGLGGYNDPTEKGRKAIEQYEKEHVHYVSMVPVDQVAKDALDILKTHIM